MDKGELVPDNVLIGIIKNRLNEEDCKKGFILDGYPRTVPQADALETILDEIDKPIDVVLNLEVPDEVLVERISGRLMCKCGASYHTIANPPKKDNICDICGGEVYQRDDDKAEAVRTVWTFTRSRPSLLSIIMKKRAFLSHLTAQRT